MFQAEVTTENAEWVPTGDDIVQYIQSGRVKYLPKRKSKEVRIFISSTFTDMYVERNMLFKSVYPKLQSYCQTRWNVDFQAVDMRWGVQSGATNDHSASSLCTAELKTCQEQSLGPNFVLLLGQRYGTRQLPTVIPEVEFTSLLNELQNLDTSDSDMELLQKWFLCDNNSYPPIRKLQPLDAYGTEASEFSGSIEPRLLTMLRAAADKCVMTNLITRDAHRRYFWSVTDEEVHNGIITANDAANRCLCFSRTFTNPNLKHSKAWRFFDLDDSGNVDNEAQALRLTMHNSVCDVLGSQSVKEFTVDWCDDGGVNEQVHASYLSDFCDEFYRRVTAMIDKTISRDNSMDVIGTSQLVTEIIEHDHQALGKLNTFQGRDDALDAVKSYLDSDSRLPLIIHGESGYGKTSIMAIASLQVFHWLGDHRNLIVVRRFLGTSPESSNFESLLQGVVTQVLGFCGMRIDQTYFDDPLQLLDKLFGLLPRTTRLILFLDSIDQLSTVGDAHALKWIPFGLPDNVRLVISTLPRQFDLLETLMRRGYPQSAYVQIDKLNPEVSMQLVQRWMSADSRHFTEYQTECIREKLKTAATSPLYIKLLFDIFKNTPSYMDAEAFAKKLQPLTEPRKCIDYIFEELRKKHGKELVNKSIAFLHFSNLGLTENELLDLLSLDDDVLNDVFQFHVPPLRRLPTVLWRRILHDMSEYIVERDSRGTKVLWWYHRHFIEAASNQISRYNTDQRTPVIMGMVDYFTGKWAGGKPKPFKYPDHIVNKLQLLSSDSEADRFVPAQPNHLNNGKLNARKIDNLSRLIRQLPASLGIELFASQVLGNIQLLIGMFTLLSSSEAVSQLQYDNTSYNLSESHREIAKDIRIIHKTLLLCCAAGSAHPKVLAPLFANHLLPFFGLSKVIDTLLQDIYSSGVSCNSLLVKNSQLESLGGPLIFELLDEHQDAVHDVLEIDNGIIISLSTKVIVSDLSEIEVKLRFSPALPPGEHFNILATAAVSDVNFFATSLAVQPVMHVFSVKAMECIGSVDCRVILGQTDFQIVGLRGLRTQNEELVAVSTSCHCGLLIFNLKKFHSPLYRLSADTVIAVVPCGSGDLLVLQPRRIHKLTFTVKDTKEIEVESTVLGSYLGRDKLTHVCYQSLAKVFALATEDSKLCVWSKEPVLLRSRLILDSSARHISVDDTAMVVCTERFIYVILDCLSESMAVNYRLSKAADLAGFLGSSGRVAAYGLGMVTSLLLNKKNTKRHVAEIRTFRAHSKPVTGFVHRDPMIFTCSADGGMRVFAPFTKSDIEKSESVKCKRMDIQIDFLRADGNLALSVSRKSRQAALWDLRSGNLTRRLVHPESAHGLRDAAVSTSTVVTVDDGGCISLWSLVGEEDAPRCTISFPNFIDFYVRPDGDLYILSPSAMALLSATTGTIIASRLLHDQCNPAYGFSTDGVAILKDAVELVIDTVDGGTPFQRQLSVLMNMRNNGAAVNDILVIKNMLIVCSRSHVTFADYERDTVILTRILKRPVLLKSNADVVAIQSGLKLNFFSIDNGVSDIGHISLSGSKDRAVLSQDGLYCIILAAPKLIRLLRVADLKEIGIYPCDSDVTCIEISRDGKHVLAGLSDTRLLSFLIVDPMCASHKSRTEGILLQSASEEEAQKKKSTLAAISVEDDSSSDEDEYDEKLLENINEIIFDPEDSVEYKGKITNYVVDINNRFWRSCAVSFQAAGAGTLITNLVDSSLVT